MRRNYWALFHTLGKRPPLYVTGRGMELSFENTPICGKFLAYISKIPNFPQCFKFGLIGEALFVSVANRLLLHCGVCRQTRFCHAEGRYLLSLCSLSSEYVAIVASCCCEISMDKTRRCAQIESNVRWWFAKNMAAVGLPNRQCYSTPPSPPSSFPSIHGPNAYAVCKHRRITP